jgi:hypothetical protein
VNASGSHCHSAPRKTDITEHYDARNLFTFQADSGKVFFSKKAKVGYPNIITKKTTGSGSAQFDPIARSTAHDLSHS